jgi:epoxyqueuosine reductase
VPALAVALNDEEVLIRGHAAWALGRIVSRPKAGLEAAGSVAALLAGRLAVEVGEWVRDEIGAALAS